MSNELNINMVDVIRDIESGKMSREDIIKKYNLTSYKYYKILKEADIKNSYNELKKKPKQTAFKRLMNKEFEDEDDNKDLFDLENFMTDCRNGMKISDLMEKYKLSLYQIRELRKKHELTTK
jgi:Mor family transcriptional regulator